MNNTSEQAIKDRDSLVKFDNFIGLMNFFMFLAVNKYLVVSVVLQQNCDNSGLKFLMMRMLL